MNEEDLLNTPLTTPELEAAVVVATSNLAERWLAAMPEAVRIAAGAGAAFEMTSSPTPRLALMLIDAEGNRRLLASRESAIEVRH